VKNLKHAMYYEKKDNSFVHCVLCPHNCIIKPGGVGICRVRKNLEGELYSLNYGKVTAISVDPVEKKPLNRFYPKSPILSAGTFGCNLKCSFCQNWNIAHDSPDYIQMSSSELAKKADELKLNGNIGLAYTYNEPLIWFEYVLETAKLIRSKELMNVLVTNGFISIEPLKEILPLVDAMNIDVKAFTDSFYKRICSGALDNVRQTVEISAKHCHVELTTLVVPGLNDSMDEIENLAKWIASISTEIPLHLSRFFPNYRMREYPPTPRKTLEKAKETAEKHLKYVYLGNV